MIQDSGPFSPLSGTHQRPRGLFVDRWGTLLETPTRGYCTAADQLRFIEGAVDALLRAHQADWQIYLIGNEDAVASGKISDRTWKRIEDSILDHLHKHGVVVQRCYSCLDHPEGKGEHRRHSVFLLPNTGPLYHAEQVDRIDLANSWVIGDSTLELAAGERAGCRVIALETGQGLSDARYLVDPRLVVRDLDSAVSALLSCEAYARH